MSRNRTDFIVVHCSATKPNMDIGAKEIKQWHTLPEPKGRGWKDIGYAEVIRLNGVREKGRDMDKDGDTFEEIGSHVAGYNGRSVGICLVGGLDMAGNPADTFTAAQMVSLAAAIKECLRRWPNAEVLGHRDFPGVAKACPCFNVKQWWKAVNK